MGKLESAATLDRIAFDGPFSVTTLIVIGVLLATCFGILAWKEGRGTGKARWFAGLFALRLVACVVVLWMLAGASRVSVRRETKPKSVVLLVDGSPSMGMVDPVDDSGGTLRWNLAGHGSGAAPFVTSLEGVIGSLRSAESSVSESRRVLLAEAWSKEGEASLARMRKAIDGAVAELTKLSAENSRTQPEAGVELGRVAVFLRDSQNPPKGRGTRTNRQLVEDRLDELESFLEAARQRVENLAQKMAATAEKALPKASLELEAKLARREKVAAWLNTAENSWLKALESRAQVSRYEFGLKVQPVTTHDWRQVLLGPTNALPGGTDLAAALNRAVEESGRHTVDAVVLVTDGGHNAVRDPREVASSLRGTPLNIVPIGTTQMPRDVILHHTHCPRAVFKNDTVVLDAMVTAYGCAGESLHLELTADGKPVETQDLQVTSAAFDGRLSFHWKAAQLGRHSLKLRITPLPREHSKENNDAEVEIEVMEDTLRVLVADDQPRWEFRYLANLFKRDQHVEFEQLLFEPNSDSPGGGARLSFPEELEGWRRYRVIILGDISPSHLPPRQQELLRKYVVEEGGNLIVIAGESSMPQAYVNQPLAQMLPITASTRPVNPAEPLGLVVTSEGAVSIATQLDDNPMASDRVWREMSSKLPIYNLSSFARPKPTSHVLIGISSVKPEAEAQAFLSWQYVGLGRVVYLAAPVTYQLRYRNGDGYHHRLWGQLLRWAVARDLSAGSKTVHLITDKNHYEEGENSQIVLRLSRLDGRTVTGGNCGVEVFRSGRSIQTVELHEEPDLPGAYRGKFENLPQGKMTFRAVGSSVDSLLKEEGRSEPVEQLVVVDPRGSSEMSDPLCNLPLLNQLADASGGAVVPPAAIENALSRLDLTPETVETVLSRTPIWNRWELLALFLGCLTIEWIIRKFYRMV